MITSPSAVSNCTFGLDLRLSRRRPPGRAAGIAAGLVLLAVGEAADAVDHAGAAPWFVLTAVGAARVTV